MGFTAHRHKKAISRRERYKRTRPREKISVVGFVLKELFTHFEMVIVSHALRCVNGH